MSGVWDLELAMEGRGNHGKRETEEQGGGPPFGACALTKRVRTLLALKNLS